MKKIFTTAAILLLFGLYVKGQARKSKPDTALRSSTLVPKVNPFVIAPVYSAARPEPVPIPNGYDKSADISVPMPTHKLKIIQPAALKPFRFRK